ncbi:hypothetical protein AJ80_01059 [Polytolypa hystricis UAMH7299]|uniref:NAD dependent epimerase/dehydratase n=1 Tax=Polytolypa hystricis (strain UAMH7299) TaxID=1447883 RepID=A0A2B7Z3E4_POLH7|nr:hypothetical protein AJ80_01059 [Polytolypa hystricis UAMH7299]
MASKGPTRKVPVEVLHLSMPRTGSVSMMSAYNTLGLTTYHGFDFMARSSDQVVWEKAIDGKFYGKGKPFEKEDFDAFLGEFAVLSDFPVIEFAEELVKMYPEAKVVLVDRDLDKWYHSFKTQIIAASYTWMVRVMTSFLDHFLTARAATTMLKLEHAMFNCSDQEGFERNAKETYQKHYEKVRNLVPKERLLEYKLGSGWEPLCEFLGKEVPQEEFPFKNETKEFAIWMRKIQLKVLREGTQTVVLKFIIPAAICAGAWMLLKAI